MSAEKKKIVKRSKTNSVMELVASRLGVTPQELEREVSGMMENSEEAEKLIKRKGYLGLH